MDLPDLLQRYGYVAVFFGTFAEGESLLLLGGYAAHRGYLALPWVIATAFVAAVASDQMYFYLGRRHGARLLARHPRLQAKVDAALHRVERHGTPIVLGMRFLWGLRTALPMAVGMSRMSARRFLLLNLVSAVLWSSCFGLIGFGAGQLLEQLIDDLHRNEVWIVAGLLIVALGVVMQRWWRSGSSSAI